MTDIISGTSFPAIKGIQAGNAYYIVMCPLKRLKKIFTFDESGLQPEDRAQRSLNPSRIPQISEYIHSNRNDYTFSSLTACIEGNSRFIPIDDSNHGSKIGTLLVDEDAEFYITDGQHRMAAIQMALEQDDSLANESISVVFFADKNLAARQKVFRDLNFYPVKAGKSLGVRYGNTPEEQLTNTVADNSIFFNGVISFDDKNLGTRSVKLFKHSSLFAANQQLFPYVNANDIEKSIELAISYWDYLAKNIKVWQHAKSNEIAPAERINYVCFTAIVLKSLGMLGNELLHDDKNWKNKLKGIKSIEWRRSNKNNWEGRCCTSLGRMNHTNTAAILTLNKIKSHLNLPLTDKQQIEENKFLEARNGNK